MSQERDGRSLQRDFLIAVLCGLYAMTRVNRALFIRTLRRPPKAQHNLTNPISEFVYSPFK
jgi:hypothetical protein